MKKYLGKPEVSFSRQLKLVHAQAEKNREIFWRWGPFLICRNAPGPKSPKITGHSLHPTQSPAATTRAVADKRHGRVPSFCKSDQSFVFAAARSGSSGSGGTGYWRKGACP